jgi:hypothetical protein
MTGCRIILKYYVSRPSRTLRTLHSYVSRPSRTLRVSRSSRTLLCESPFSHPTYTLILLGEWLFSHPTCESLSSHPTCESPFYYTLLRNEHE